MTEPEQTLDPTARGPAWFWWVLIGLTIGAAVLRGHRLGESSFWVDECFTVKWSLATAQGERDFRPLAYTPHVLGYWLAGIDVAGVEYEDYATWKASGINELVARVPTMVTGVLGVFVLGWLSRRVIGWQAALVLTLLLALSTWHLWASQTARFYAQQMLIYSISFILYYDATRRGSRPAMFFAALFLVFAFWTQLTSLVLVAVFGVDWLAGLLRRRPVRWGAWGWLCLGCVAVFCVLFYWVNTGDPVRHVSGFSGSKQSGWGQVLYLPFMVGLVVATLSLLGLGWLWRRDRRLAILLAANMFVPLIAILSLNELFGMDVHVRYLIVSLYGWLATAALALWKLQESLLARSGFVFSWTPLAVVFVMLSFDVLVYYDGAHGFHARWRDAFEYVREHRAAGEVVVGDYIPRLLGNYYLEEPHDQILGITEDMEGAAYAGLTGGRPMWFVVRGVSPTASRRFDWVHRNADLKTYFDARTYQPYASVHVYYYDPAWQAREQSTDPVLNEAL